MDDLIISQAIDGMRISIFMSSSTVGTFYGITLYLS